MPKTAITYQPHLLDPHSAEPQPVSPANGKSFRLAELYQLLDCRTVDVVRLTDELILIIDDEGKFRTPATSICWLPTSGISTSPPPATSIPLSAAPSSATTSNSASRQHRGPAASGGPFWSNFFNLSFFN